jgi:hypothetical protein
MLGALTFVSAGWQLARRIFCAPCGMRHAARKIIAFIRKWHCFLSPLRLSGWVLYFLVTFSFQRTFLKDGLIAVHCLRVWLSNVWGLF